MDELDRLYARLLRALGAGLDTKDQLAALAERIPEVVRQSDAFLVFSSTLTSYNKAEIRSNLVPFMQEQLATLWPQVRTSVQRAWFGIESPSSAAADAKRAEEADALEMATARQHADAGRTDEAVAAWQRLLESRRGRYGETDLRTACAHQGLGSVLLEAGRLRAAEESLVFALSLQLLHGTAHASCLLELSRLYSAQGRTVEAIQHAADALPLCQTAAGRARVAVQLARLQGDAAAWERAVGALEAALGPEHPVSLQFRLQFTAACRPEDTPAALRRLRTTLPSEHPLCAWGLQQYARTLMRQQRLVPARDVALEALRQAQAHHRTFPTLVALLQCDVRVLDSSISGAAMAPAAAAVGAAAAGGGDGGGAGGGRAAAVPLSSTDPIIDLLPSPQHPLAVYVWQQRARSALAAGRPSAALQAARTALATGADVLGRTHPALAVLHNLCAVAQLALNDPDAALSSSRQAVSLLESLGDRTWFGLAAALQNEAAALVRLQQFNEALAPLTRAAELRRAMAGAEDVVARELDRHAELCRSLSAAQG